MLRVMNARINGNRSSCVIRVCNTLYYAQGQANNFMEPVLVKEEKELVEFLLNCSKMGIKKAEWHKGLWCHYI